MPTPNTPTPKTPTPKTPTPKTPTPKTPTPKTPTPKTPAAKTPAACKPTPNLHLHATAMKSKPPTVLCQTWVVEPVFKSAGLLLSSMLLVCFVSGCGSPKPVENVAISSSGVKIVDVANSAQWGMFRGPQGDGRVAGTAPTQWSENENIVWAADVPGRGHGSPTVVGELVVLPTALDDLQQQWVVAFNRADGKELWREKIHDGGFPSNSELHPKGTNANSTVTSDGERLYSVFFNSGKVTATCLNLDGKQVWQKELGTFKSKFGFAPSPVHFKSLVIFAVDNLGGGYISALDAATGTLAWRVAREAKNSHSTPAIFTLDGRPQMLISGCDTVTSYDPATGEEIWSTPCTSETTCGTMVAEGDLVFASGGFPDQQTVCLNASGEIQWTNRTKIYEPSLLAVDGAIYAVSDRGIGYCWDAQTGQERWKERLAGGFSSSPWTAGGLIYASDLSGQTHIFKASADALEVVAKCELGTDCYATPAVVDGRIFTRVGFGKSQARQEKLYCIGSE